MFEVTTGVTREGCRAQAKSRMRHHFREICILLAVLGLGTTVLFAIHSDKAKLVGAVFAAALFYGAVAVPATSMRLYASRNTAVDSVWLCFGEEDLFVSTNVEETYIEYSGITRLDENSKYMVLYVKHHTPLVFKKAEVADGRTEALKAFLEEKTGHAFRSFGG